VDLRIGSAACMSDFRPPSELARTGVKTSERFSGMRVAGHQKLEVKKRKLEVLN